MEGYKDWLSFIILPPRAIPCNFFLMYLTHRTREDGVRGSWILGSRKEIINFSKVGWFRKPLSSSCRRREYSVEFSFFFPILTSSSDLYMLCYGR